MYIFLSFLFGAILFYLSKFFPYICLIISLAILPTVIFYYYKSASLKLLHIIIIFIFSASGFLYAKSLNIVSPSPSELAGSIIEVKGFLKSERAISSKKGISFLQNIEVINASTSDMGSLKISELRAINEISLSHHKIYRFIGSFSRDGYYLNPSSKDNMPILYIKSSEELSDLKRGFFDNLRQRLNIFMRQSLTDESSAFLLSITTGERIFISKELNNAFNATGLAHILSISGSHFGLLFVILFGCFRTFFIYLPYNLLSRLTIYFTPSQIAGLLTAPFLIFYLFISNMSIPTIRSFIMIVLFLIGLLLFRKDFWLNTIAIAAFIIVLIQPNSITDISFQLSFIAVLSIGIAIEMLKQEKPYDEEAGTINKKNFISNFIAFIIRSLKYSLAISIAATIGTAPLVAYYFHYFSTISPLTNLIITPFIGFIILPLILFSSLIYLIADVFPFVSFIDTITLFTLDIIKEISNWDYIDIKIAAFPLIFIITFYIGILLFLIFKNLQTNRDKKWSSSLSFTLLISILPFIIYACFKLLEPKELKITFLDIGQGDASVIELADNRIIVIDTGRSGYQVGEFLKYRGIRNIDVISISHMQSDHIGGIEYLLNNFNVSEIWGSFFSYNSEIFQQVPYKSLRRGDVIKAEDYLINILHPYDEFYTQSSKGEENNYSLVLSIKTKKNIFLFTGDIEREAQEDLSHLKEHLRSNILKVPHHGSKSSAHEGFYSLVSPEIAVISVGKKNLHGHPHEETLSLLKDSLILRTDIDGAVGLREMPNGNLKVKTCREFYFREAKDISDEMHNIKRLFTVW